MKIKMLADASYDGADYGEGREYDVTESVFANIRNSCMIILKEKKIKVPVQNIEPELKNKIKMILVVISYGVGNIINKTPMLILLRQMYPKATIDVAIEEKKYMELLKDWSIISNLYWFDNLNNNPKKYDVIINTVPSKNKIHTSNIQGKVFSGGNLELKKCDIHEVDINCNILKNIGWPGGYIPETHICVNERDQLKFDIEFKGKKLIGICAGYDKKSMSWNHKKNWGNKNYAELILLLREKYKDYAFVIMGVGDEKEVYTELLKLINQKSTVSVGVYNRVDCYNLKEGAAVLKKCEFVVMNDTGLAHLAAAVGTKTYTIFGPTPIIKATPYRHGVVISKNLECSPCYYLPGYQNCSHMQCMDMSPEYVADFIGEQKKEVSKKKKYKVGVIMATYNRPYMLLATLKAIIDSDMNNKDVKICIVNDGSENEKVDLNLLDFLIHAKCKTIIQDQPQGGKKNYWKTLQRSFGHLSDCEHILFMPDDFIIHTQLYAVIKKSFKYFKNDNDVKCITFFRDCRTEKPYNQFDKVFFERKKYDTFFEEVQGADGFLCLFEYGFLEKINWHAPSDKARTNVWRHNTEQIHNADGKILMYCESLGEHIGNCHSMFWENERKRLKIDAANLNLFDVPKILSGGEIMKQAEFEKPFEYSQKWYEEEYHSKGAYNLPKRNYEDVDTEWIAAGYKKRLYNVLTEMEKIVDVEKIEHCLEVACHHGKSVFWMAERWEEIKFKAFDFSRVAIDWCKKNNPFGNRIRFKLGNVICMPYNDTWFDFVTCMDIAEHLPTGVYFSMLQELKRVMRPDGYLLFYCGRTKLPEHINLRSIAQQKEDLNNAGFNFICHLPDFHMLFKLKEGKK